jgi:hypothetical protein
MISYGWIISHRCSWIMVYVLCCNSQVNLIVIFMTCTCIVMHSLFCQLSNCNLFSQHVVSLWRDTSSELWTPVHTFTFILSSAASTIYFLQPPPGAPATPWSPPSPSLTPACPPEVLRRRRESPPPHAIVL